MFAPGQSFHIFISFIQIQKSFATTGKHRLLGQQIVVHWVVNLYEAVVERSKSGRPDKVIFRCKMILILYIFNLGKRVWKAAQKEMKRTANAEKNLQKKVETRSCMQDFSAKKSRTKVLQAGFFI